MTVVRELTERDWPAVRAIYAAGIATGNATFETSVPSWSHWDATHLPGQRLAAVLGAGGPAAPAEPTGPGELVGGWAALAPVPGSRRTSPTGPPATAASSCT